MSLISIPFTFTVGAVIVASQHNSNFSTIYSDYNGNIQDANIASNAAISDNKLAQITSAGKVSGAALTSLASIPPGAGVIPSANISFPVPTSVSLPYIKCSNTQSSGTGGGTATSGSWLTVPLNTKDTDTGSIATLSSNQIAIPSGTYIVKAHCNFASTNKCQTRLFNISDNSLIITGSSQIASTGADYNIQSWAIGQFTIGATKTIAYQYQVQTTVSTNGLGAPCSFGSEVFSVVELLKVS